MARGSNSRDGRSARSETINRAYGSPLKRDKDGVFKDAEGNTYTDERAYGMITKEDLEKLKSGGRAARSEGQPASNRQQVAEAVFNVLSTTAGMDFNKKYDLRDSVKKLDEGLKSLDDANRAKLFDSFKSKGQTGYYLDKETVDYARAEALRRWDNGTLRPSFDYLKAEFPEEFKEFTKDWAFSERSTTPTVEAKARDIFADAVIRRVSALVNGAKNDEDSEVAIKNYERSQQYAPYGDYKTGLTGNNRFKQAVTGGMNEAIQIARDVIASRLIAIVDPYNK